MPKYEVDAGDERLEIRGGPRSGRVVVISDAKEIDAAPARDFAKARTYDLGGGVEVEVRLVRGKGFDVRRDGRLLKGSVSHAATAARSAATFVYVVAVITLVGWLLLGVLVGRSDSHAADVGGGVAIAVGLALGVVFAGLGFAVSRGSLAALWVAIAIYGVDTAVTVLSMNLIAIAVHVCLLYGMFRGVGAIRTAQRLEERSRARVRAGPAA